MITLGLLNSDASPDLDQAHKHCTKNRNELAQSSVCGCFYCLQIYDPREIAEWVDEGMTAICAKCPVDSVLGSASGYPIRKDFLAKMHERWF